MEAPRYRREVLDHRAARERRQKREIAGQLFDQGRQFQAIAGDGATRRAERKDLEMSL